MSVTVITMVKNEEILLPFFFRHYERFADRILVHDNGSTDRTIELIKAHPKAELRLINTHGEFKDSALLSVKNMIYQMEPDEWFFIVDCDEFIWHRDMLSYLKRCDDERVSLPRVAAYDMIGKEIPIDDGKTQLWEIITNGFRRPFYDKQAVVNKDVKINYNAGCHECKPTGRVQYSKDVDLLLLHFAWLSEEYRIKRAEETAKVMSAENKSSGWSTHYLDIPGLRKYYKLAAEQAEPICLK